jgi:prepilin-type N-terminal cleavage/methylation domain-containing protein
MLNKKQAGFTLVEIAIVLVIVGLLIGGVLKGQEMITNAKLKRIESDNAGLLAALYSYQDRYLQLPGDDAAASGRFSAYTGTIMDGDGDGAIGCGANPAGCAAAVADWNQSIAATLATGAPHETLKFFAHLRAAGLVAGAPDDVNRPANAFGGPIGVQDGSLGMSGQVTIFGGIDGPIASILDGRLDDSNPAAGRVQAQVVGGAGMLNAAAAATAYSDQSSYNMAFRL